MIKVICGSAIEVLENQIEKESIDTIYTAPSPFGYYEDEETGKLGSESRLDDYINNLMNILLSSHEILKPSGSFFLQIPESFNKIGGIFGMPVIIENRLRNLGLYFMMNRLFWHRTEDNRKKRHYKEKGFLKNYEYIFHLVKDHKEFYFNENSKYARTSVFSYPLEDSYYTNEFDSGLPSELTKMIIDTTVPTGGNGTILDPLAGSGKVGAVAKKINRNAILIDIDPSICELMRIRLGIDS